MVKYGSKTDTGASGAPPKKEAVADVDEKTSHKGVTSMGNKEEDEELREANTIDASFMYLIKTVLKYVLNYPVIEAILLCGIESASDISLLLNKLIETFTYTSKLGLSVPLLITI